MRHIFINNLTLSVGVAINKALLVFIGFSFQLCCRFCLAFSYYFCLVFPGFRKAEQNVSQKGFSPCQMDHRQSNWNQDAENCKSESNKAGARSLPAEGESLLVIICSRLQLEGTNKL